MFYHLIKSNFVTKKKIKNGNKKGKKVDKKGFFTHKKNYFFFYIHFFFFFFHFILSKYAKIIKIYKRCEYAREKYRNNCNEEKDRKRQYASERTF